MNLIEAVKSGKHFRRHGDAGWMNPGFRQAYNHDDILADDWEVKREPREFWINVTAKIIDESTECPGPKNKGWIKVREVIE